MSDLETTRLSLHAVAELVLAGPQYLLSGTIKLRPVPGGFGTVRHPDARVRGTSLVAGGWTVPLDGSTAADLAAAAGLVARPLVDVYGGGCGLTAEHPLRVDPAGAAEIAEAFRRGDESLAELDPDAERVLWPEHFDVGISVDRVNYGVSPGDSYLAVPYAYVGPWSPTDFTGRFWNTPFGAARRLSEVDDLYAFFAEGRALTAPA
jgi:hypothetical protein